MSQDVSLNDMDDLAGSYAGHEMDGGGYEGGIVDPEKGAGVNAPGADDEVMTAMQEVDLTRLSEADVLDLESGNPEQIARALSNGGPVDAPTRISLKAITDPEERRALAEATRMVRDGKHPNLKSALVEALGLSVAGQAEVDDEGDDDADTLGYEHEVSGIEGRIAVLQERRLAAKDVFDYEQAESLLEEIAELKVNLSEAKRESVLQDAEMRGWKAEEDNSREQALELYPELGDANSDFYLLVEDEIVLAEYKRDAIFSSPDWPEKIASRVHEKYGYKFGGGYAEPSGNRASSRIPSPPPRGVRMPGSPVGPAANSAAVTAQGALAQLAQLSLEEQDAVLAMLDMNEQKRARQDSRQSY